MKEQQIKLTKIPTTSYKFKITKGLQDKIDFLCSKMLNREWSGVLFYRTIGSMSDNTLELEGVDLYLMDIGSGSYTEFMETPDVVGYIAENPELIECKTGLIHSHHSMKAFLSGTDAETLRTEGIDTNHFLSLIVNNSKEYVAFLTRKVRKISKIQSCISYDSFDGNSYKDTSSDIEEFEEIEYFDLDIEYSNSDYNFAKDMLDRIKILEVSKCPMTNTVYTQYEHPKQLEFNMPFTKPKSEYTQDKILYSFSKKDKKEDIDTNFADTLIIRLLTGSNIVVSNKFELDKWIKSMPSLYKQRFSNIDSFDIWADCYIDYLINDLSVAINRNDEILSTYVDYIIMRLEELPTNEYLTIYIDTLKLYGSEL